MKKELMPKPLTGVYRRPRSANWQLRIKVPSDLTSLYPTEWACRVSLDTSDLREANEKAAKLWAEWTARFDEQRHSLNPREGRADHSRAGADRGAAGRRDHSGD